MPWRDIGNNRYFMTVLHNTCTATTGDGIESSPTRSPKVRKIPFLIIDLNWNCLSLTNGQQDTAVVARPAVFFVRELASGRAFYPDARHCVFSANIETIFTVAFVYNSFQHRTVIRTSP